MSMPTFPVIEPSLTRDDAVNQILSSIAMEELGLSHILNAEGEKIQHVLGTLEGQTPSGATVQDLLAIDESVRATIDSVRQTQATLREKMESALAAVLPTDTADA